MNEEATPNFSFDEETGRFTDFNNKPIFCYAMDKDLRFVISNLEEEENDL